MGLGDYISGQVTRGIEDSLPKVQGALDDSVGKARTQADEIITGVEQRGHTFLDGVQDRLRAATETFFTDLERRWENRLEAETRAQFKLLNRVLVYTLAVAVLSLLYALARTKLGW